MGQRHQAFVIARILPHSSTTPKYRCIAAYHDQWCYGRLPLRAVDRFITQVKRKNNATIISSEIAAIQGEFGRWGEEPALPKIPCPFTAFLLATNWSVDLDPEGPYASGISFNNNAIPADMGSTEGDNNDGISVIDVTDPTAPSYCFVSIYGLEAGGGAVPELVPLSAEQYVRVYYPKYSPPVKSGRDETEQEAIECRRNLEVENDVQDVIAKLQDVKLVDWEMLAEAWPAEYDPDGKLKRAADTTTGPVPSDFPSLFDLTIPPAVAHAVQSGDTKDIEAMVWLPGKASAIKVALRSLCPFPDAGMGLLMKIMEQEVNGPDAELDLGGFALSPAQLEKLVSSLKEVNASVANLSHMSTLSIDGVRTVLTKFPQLKRLNLAHCPSISSDSVYSLLDAEPHLFNHLEALIHPSLLAELRDTDDYCPYHNAFSYIGVFNRNLKACSLPFFTPSRVIQALIDILQPLCDRHNVYSFTQTSFAMQAAFSSVRAPGQKWSERDTVIIPQMALRREGWTFATTMSGFECAGGSLAFLQFKPDPASELTWEIHDFASFVNQTVVDGKPRPAEEAVNKLQSILTRLHTNGMKLMDDNDVKDFLYNLESNLRHMY